LNYSHKRKFHTRRKKAPSILIRLTVLTLCFIAVRSFVTLGGGSAFEDLLSSPHLSGKITETLLDIDLNNGTADDPSYAIFSTVMSTLPIRQDDLDLDTVQVSESSPTPTEGNVETDTVAEAPGLFYQTDDSQQSSDSSTEDIPLPDSGIDIDWSQHLDASGIQIKNYSAYDVDTDALLNADLNLSFTADSPSVLIVHSHGSESYTADANNPYVETDPWRTEDTNYNVVHVGDVLTELLQSAGINVIHDRTLNDYPSYDGSYNRALEVIEGYLEEYPSICIVIDLHRDAVQNTDGSAVRTTATIDGKECSQIMLVMGTDSTGLYHPYWQENLKLALRLQYAMDTMYPTLTKPIDLSEYRYNMHATLGSMIVEVGGIGNTLDESVTAVTYFADAIIEVLSPLGAC
jgi:stage II sporulation protein P